MNNRVTEGKKVVGATHEHQCPKKHARGGTDCPGNKTPRCLGRGGEEEYQSVIQLDRSNQENHVGLRTLVFCPAPHPHNLHLFILLTFTFFSTLELPLLTSHSSKSENHPGVSQVAVTPVLYRLKYEGH